MPLLIGFLLIPVGALIGTWLFFLAMTVLSGRVGLTGGEWVGASFIGLTVGSAFAAPIGLIVLPLTYAIMRRKGGLNIGRLVVIATAFGFVSVLVALSLWWRPANLFGDTRSYGLTFGLAVDGALTAAICAYLFGRFMRWFTSDPPRRASAPDASPPA